MTEKIIAEMAPPEAPRPFYRTWRGFAIILGIAAVICAGIFSFWISLGKISSVRAILEATVFTVGSEYPALFEKSYVMPGEIVAKGQPLGVIQPKQAKKSGKSFVTVAGAYDTVESAEKDIAVKLEKAREDEVRARKLHQDAVTTFVRAQLARRSLREGTQARAAAQEQENQIKKQVDMALEQFEKISHWRSALEQSLQRVRAAIKLAKSNPEILAKLSVPVKDYMDSVELVSPASGKVIGVGAMTGQTVEPGQNIYVIMPENSESTRWVQAWFPMADKGKLKKGQSASVHFNKNNLVANGKVEAISQEGQALDESERKNEASGKLYLSARIALDNPFATKNLEPGAKAECQIQSRQFPGF